MIEDEFKQLKQILINRLEEKGVEKCLIPGFLRLLANSYYAYRVTNLHLVRQRLNYLGWNDFDLDEYTFQLAIACFEAEHLSNFKSIPSNWFVKNFMINEAPMQK
jgi:hypothetical protein